MRDGSGEDRTIVKSKRDHPGGGSVILTRREDCADTQREREE